MMGSEMRVFKLFYNSIEVEESVFLMLFFRMLGIYVYEKQIDWDQREDELLAKLDYKSNIQEAQYDINIFLLKKDTDFEWFKEYFSNLDKDNLKKSILVSIGNNKDFGELSNKIYINEFRLEKENCLTDLKALISALSEKLNLSEDYKKSYNKLAEIFVQNDMCKLILQTKFFYAQKSKFETINNKYNKIYTELVKYFKENCGVWGGTACIPIQIAILNIVYDIDFYARKCEEPMPYTPASCIRVSDKILLNLNDEIGTEIKLIKAQVYSDLLDEISSGFEYYLDVCRDYNAYAYYRKALCYQQTNDDYDNAILYYKKSILIFPEYYRAWFALGMCYFGRGNWQEAINSFSCVKQILNNKIENKCLRPLEMDYLYQSYKKIGEIYAEKLGKEKKGLGFYYSAYNIWISIKDSNFWEYMYKNKEEIGEAQSVIRDKFNIGLVYNRLSILNQIVGNSEEALKFYILEEQTEE